MTHDLGRASLAKVRFKHPLHTTVTRFFEAGSNMTQVRSVTGHSNISLANIMDRYAISTADLAEQAFAKRKQQENAAG